jgi:GntR family transcriptional regulator / MocR family aminotransferase
VKKRRTADGADLLVVVDADSPVPMHRQVYEGLRSAIVEGRIAAGARLPSTRALAAELSVARNTVTAAFEQLRAEGYVSARSGGGTRVKDVLPDRLLRLPQRAPRRTAASATAGGGRVVSADGRGGRATGGGGAGRGTSGAAAGVIDGRTGELSRRGERLVAAARWFPAVAQGGEAFRVGTPALDDFPVALWGRLVSHRWRRPPP